MAAQIQKCMKLDRSFAFPEFRPGEKRQIQIDSGRIQGVHCLIQFDAEGISGVKLSGFYYEYVGEIGVNPPIPILVGMGESVAGNLSPNAQVVQFGLSGPKAGLNISQAFSVGELSEGHTKELIPAGKAYDVAIAVVSIDAFLKLVCGDKIHQLGKDGFPGIHVLSPFLSIKETGMSEK